MTDKKGKSYCQRQKLKWVLRFAQDDKFLDGEQVRTWHIRVWQIRVWHIRA
jgi:hypothetical protein